VTTPDEPDGLVLKTLLGCLWSLGRNNCLVKKQTK